MLALKVTDNESNKTGYIYENDGNLVCTPKSWPLLIGMLAWPLHDAEGNRIPKTDVERWMRAAAAASNAYTRRSLVEVTQADIERVQ